MMTNEPIAIAVLPSTTVARTDALVRDKAGDRDGFIAGCQAPQRQTTFCFLASQNQEHVRLVLNVDGLTVDMGERAHHQTLLFLGRERREDERQNIIPSEAGWRDVELLGTMLGIDTPHINTHIFRALRQLSPVMIQLAIKLDLVERRRGQLRFGEAVFDVRDWRGLPTKPV